MKDLEVRGAHVRQLDVTDTDQVNSVVSSLVAAEGRIDALLANAGYGSYGMVESVRWRRFNVSTT